MDDIQSREWLLKECMVRILLTSPRNPHLSPNSRWTYNTLARELRKELTENDEKFIQLHSFYTPIEGVDGTIIG